MNEESNAIEPQERGKGYDGVILPLMLLGGAFGVSVFIGWFVFFGLYFLFILGFMFSIFALMVGAGF